MADSSSSPAPASAASPVLAIVYWLVAGVPLAWGVYQTVQKSIPLFHVTTAAAPAAPVPAGADPTVVAPSGGAATPAALSVPETAATPAAVIAPVPDASPFSTPQPSATVSPITTPVPPTT